MKRIIIILIILIAVGLTAYDTEINISSSFRSCNDITKSYDYQYLFELYHPNIELVYENDRELGEYHNNYSIKLMQKWKYVEVNALRVDNQTQLIDLSQVDVRYRLNRNWLQSATFGVAQRWKYGIPQTDLVIGKDVEFNFRFFLMPTTIKIFADTFTNDFKEFDYETRTVINFELNPDIINNIADISGKDLSIPKINLMIKAWLREFGSEKYWQMKMELNIKL